ncbi:hypothetical protein HDV04_002375, partial [Boothiomyces sp. JEL0838]
MAFKIWVKLGSNYPAKVSTAGCKNVKQFLQACKNELDPDLNNVPVGRLILSTTEGGEAINPGFVLAKNPSLPGCSPNDHLNPLFIRVVGNFTSVV